MKLDHIFIFTNDGERAAQQLVGFGFSANDSRTHKGQGTTNRTFSFANFYLEIVWVHNEVEIKSKHVRATNLWKRAEYHKNNFSPFGLVVTESGLGEEAFADAYRYQPEYFAEGLAFYIISNDHQPGLPWTCRLPLESSILSTIQPAYPANKKILTQAIFEYRGTDDKEFVGKFDCGKVVRFEASERNWLTLVFDEAIQESTRTILALNLTIKY